MSHAPSLRRRAALAALLALVALGAGAVNAFAASSGQVYALTNDSAGNAVKAFDRAADGTLAPAGEFATGGAGTGSGLGSQGALVLDGRHLFAVNAGSSSISVFRVKRHSLRLVDTEASGGSDPISLTVSDGLLYVLNAGGTGNISGFTVSRKGDLSPLASSTRPLSGSGAGPAEVSFDSDDDALVVTEKNTNLIDTYVLDEDSGLPGPPRPQASSGATPFGFAFDTRHHLIVSEAFGGAADQSAVSSYRLDDGALRTISPSVGTTETAACWIVITDNGRYAYAANTGSGSVSGYRLAHDGRLTLLDADGRTGLAGAAPADMALSAGSRFLYARNGGDGTISGFRVGAGGSLTPVAGAGGLTPGAAGLAAR